MDNKTLLDNISARTGMAPETVAKLAAAMADIIAQCGVEMDTVAIPSFGNFEPKKRQERISVHPATGKRLLIPPKIVMGFKPSAILKSQLR